MKKIKEEEETRSCGSRRKTGLTRGSVRRVSPLFNTQRD